MPDLTSLLIAIAPFIAIGFAAQMIDGALGMAFGVSRSKHVLARAELLR